MNYREDVQYGDCDILDGMWVTLTFRKEKRIYVNVFTNPSLDLYFKKKPASDRGLSLDLISFSYFWSFFMGQPCSVFSLTKSQIDPAIDLDPIQERAGYGG